ncbi:MAG: geranylgeranyl reductase family protein [Oceanidesulfovibrio sp.]
MSTEYDCIVIGAGPAGCTFALMAARKGLSVLLLERHKLPRSKDCGDFISSPAIGVLRSLGVLDELLLAPFTRVNSILFHAPDGEQLTVPLIKFAEDDPVSGVICRRVIFDDVLQQAARSECDLRDWCRVTEILQEDGRAFGVRADYGGGRMLTATARLLVGADGADSILGRAMGLPRYTDFRNLAVQAYYRQVLGTQGCIEAHFPESVLPGYLWLHPTESGQTNVGLSIPIAAVKDRKLKPKHLLGEALQSPQLRDRFEFAELDDPPRVSELPVANTLREVHGEGFVLLGDAAGLVHPCNAIGIANSMRSAAVAAGVAEEVLVGENALATADALGKYPYRLWKELGPHIDLAGRLLGLRTPQAIGSLLRSARRRPKNAAWISAVLLGSAVPSEDMDSFLSYLNFFSR